MVTVFWDSVGVILVDFMFKRATINSDVYNDALKKLKARIRRVRPALEMSKVLLQHGNPDGQMDGQITNGKRSTVKMLPGSVLLCLDRCQAC